MAQSIPASAEPGSKRRFVRSVFRSAWQIILLQEKVYDDLCDVERPFRRGFLALTVILTTVALASALGMVFNYLTLPRFDLIQQAIDELLKHTITFLQGANTLKLYLVISDILLNLAWFVIRWTGIYPSQLSIVTTLFTTLVFGLFDWITYVFIQRFVIRLFGGTTERGPFYGLMAWTYAPQLVNVAAVIPGVAVPASLIRIWVMAAAYQAIRSTLGLSWWRSILIVILPYFISILLLALALILGIALGVAISGVL